MTEHAFTSEAVRELIGAYVDAVDRGRIEALVSLFAVDGTLEIIGNTFDAGTYTGHDAITRRLETSRDQLAGERTRIRHHVSSIRVFEHPERGLVADSYFLAVTDSGPDHWGRYADDIVGVDGRPRFRRRRVIHEGFRSGSWIEHELEAASRRSA